MGRMTRKQGRKHVRQDFAVAMMLAAVVGALAQVAQVLLDTSKSAG